MMFLIKGEQLTREGKESEGKVETFAKDYNASIMRGAEILLQ